MTTYPHYPPLSTTIPHFSPPIPPLLPTGSPQGMAPPLGVSLENLGLGRKSAVDGRHDVGGLSRNGGNVQRRDLVVCV